MFICLYYRYVYNICEDIIDQLLIKHLNMIKQW